MVLVMPSGHPRANRAFSEASVAGPGRTHSYWAGYLLKLSYYFSTEEFPDSAHHPSGHLYTLATVSLVEWKEGMEQGYPNQSSLQPANILMWPKIWPDSPLWTYLSLSEVRLHVWVFLCV